MDYNRSPDDHEHRSHRFLAANNFVPALPRLEGSDQHVNQTNAWLQGQIDVRKIRDKWAQGPVVNVVSKSLKPSPQVLRFRSES